MGENFGSKVTYFVVGLGLGALVGILFAPKSGEETREFLVEKADEGSKYAQRKARELKERAEDLIEKSKEVAARQKESITAAVDEIGRRIESDLLRRWAGPRRAGRHPVRAEVGRGNPRISGGEG